MSENKNRFKALLSDENKSNVFTKSKRWNNKKVSIKDNNNDNSRWKSLEEDKKNVFKSRRNNSGGRGRKFYGKSRIHPINKDPNFKPNLVGRGEVSFVPQYKKTKQIKNKKEKLKPLIKKEEDMQMMDDDLAITLAMAQKYQYFTESEEEEGENQDEEEDDTSLSSKDNSAW